jgi:hypothetical protein
MCTAAMFNKKKGALLVYCIHVSMVLKEQAHDGIMPFLCCPMQRSLVQIP